MEESIFLEHLKWCSQKDNDNLESLVARWRSAREKLTSISRNEKGAADGLTLRPLPESLDAKIREVTSQPAFKNEFAEDSEFKLVGIDNLVVPQLAVYLDYAEQLVSKYPKNPSLEQLFSICIALQRVHSDVSEVKLNNSNRIFYAPSKDFRFIRLISENVENRVSPELIKGIPVIGFGALLGFGLPVVNVLSTGGRMILKNGLHRLFALKSMGVSEVPAIVVFQNASEKIGDFNLEYLLDSPRPPLLKDFFNPALTIEVSLIPRKKGIRLSLTAETFYTQDSTAD